MQTKNEPMTRREKVTHEFKATAKLPRETYGSENSVINDFRLFVHITHQRSAFTSQLFSRTGFNESATLVD